MMEHVSCTIRQKVGLIRVRSGAIQFRKRYTHMTGAGAAAGAAAAASLAVLVAMGEAEAAAAPAVTPAPVM